MNDPDRHHSSADIVVAGGHGLELPPRGRAGRRARIALLVVGLLLVAGAARTIVSNLHDSRRLADVTKQNARQYVSVVRPARTGANSRIVLPGTLRGFVESPIYSRANGYVLRWYADIGTHVKQGQLLADIDTPEIDEQLSQAVAQRQQAAATLALAKVSFDRAQQLRQHDAVSQQEFDDRQGTYNQDVANLTAADANVRRLTQMKGFQHIVAPFTGVITQRNVDVGDLVNAGNSGTTGALFSIAQPDPLRLYVEVPQTYSQQVKVGDRVSVTQQELPGVTFDGTVTRTSEAIDVPTRSLQIEITLPNHDGKLMPGAYVEATLQTSSPGWLTVPDDTLLFRAEGPSVAVVDNGGKVQLKPIQIVNDLGQTLEVGHGLDLDDRVIRNPGDSIASGDEVVVQSAAAASGASGASGTPAASGASEASGASGASGASDATTAKRSTP